MSNFKQCPIGHYYDSEEYDCCPYCPREYASTSEVDPMANHTLVKQMMTIPICKHCGRPLRKGIPHPPLGEIITSLHDKRDHIVPWNYEWNGRCEHCGYDYNVYMQTATGSTGMDNHCKYTTIKCSGQLVPHHVTAYPGAREATGLSGVEIETWFDNGRRRSVFLSAKEIIYLFKVLQDSPILKQYDYSWCDFDKQYT